jgi:hypothetical protein
VGHAKAANAAVIGAYHPKWDERPLLLVQLKPGEQATKEEFLAFLEGKIAKWWTPDDVVFVDDIPLGATGKIDKKLIRERMKDYVLPTAAKGQRLAQSRVSAHRLCRRLQRRGGNGRMVELLASPAVGVEQPALGEQWRGRGARHPLAIRRPGRGEVADLQPATSASLGKRLMEARAIAIDPAADEPPCAHPRGKWADSSIRRGYRSTATTGPGPVTDGRGRRDADPAVI